MSSRDLGNNNQPEASDDAWSYVVPHFKTLSADVQSLIKTTLPTLVQAAQKLSTQSGSASSNTQAKHNLGIVAPGVSYEVTGADRWSSTGGNTQEAILGNKFHKTHLTHSQTIGEDLTQEQQEDYVASYSKIHGQSLEQNTSHKFEEIGGNFNSAIGTNNLSNQNADTSNSDGSSPSPSSTYAYAQNIYGSRKVSIKENDAVQANSLTEVYGDADTMGTEGVVVHNQTLYGGQNQMIQGDHFKSVAGVSYYTYGANGPQPTRAPTPTPTPTPINRNSTISGSMPNSKMSLMGLGVIGTNTNQTLSTNNLAVVVPSDAESTSSPTPSDENSPSPSWLLGALTWQQVSGNSIYQFNICAGSVYNQTDGTATSRYEGPALSYYFEGAQNVYTGEVNTNYLGMYSQMIVGLQMETIIGVSMPLNLFNCGQNIPAAIKSTFLKAESAMSVI